MLFIAAVCAWGAFILLPTGPVVAELDAARARGDERQRGRVGRDRAWLRNPVAVHAAFWLGLVPFLLYVIGSALRLF
jgi:hypothetical protein